MVGQQLQDRRRLAGVTRLAGGGAGAARDPGQIAVPSVSVIPADPFAAFPVLTAATVEQLDAMIAGWSDPALHRLALTLAMILAAALVLIAA